MNEASGFELFLDERPDRTGPNDPPRGANPAVAPYYAELWAYLSARASGELPPAALVPLR